MWHVCRQCHKAVWSKLEPLSVCGEGDSTLEHEHRDWSGRGVFAEVRSSIQDRQDDIHAWIFDQCERIASMRADWRVCPQFGKLSTEVVAVEGYRIWSFGSRLIGVAVEHGGLRGVFWRCELEAVNGVVFALGLNHQIGNVIFPALKRTDGLKNILYGVGSGLRICVRDWIGIAFDGVR